MVLKPDYQTFASLFKSNGGKKGKIVLLHQILQPETNVEDIAYRYRLGQLGIRD